jgi:two-component SAPR family response regulator|tara:strand:+ start:5266 stop:5628 length:363 start_codon:yes stop_codon:yes gene_type:complete
MTFTDREKKIVLIKYIIHGVAPFSEAPLGTRIKMLKAAVEKCGMVYNDDELMQIGQECIELQGQLNSGLMEFLRANKDMIVKAHQEIDKGNESLREELGDDIVKKSDKVLKNPKWYDKFR